MVAGGIAHCLLGYLTRYEASTLGKLHFFTRAPTRARFGAFRVIFSASQRILSHIAHQQKSPPTQRARGL